MGSCGALRRRSVRLLAGVSCAGLVVTSCVPPAAEQTFPRRFAEETLMGDIQAAGHIDVGIPAEAPPLALPKETSGSARGLAAEMGAIVADTLHVTPRFVRAGDHRLIRLLDDGKLDLAFVAAPVTESRLRAHPFANPYVVAHQRLLVPWSSAIRSVDELDGARVCAFIDPATGVDITKLAPGVEVEPAGALDDCMRSFARREVDAVTAEDLYLEYLATKLESRGRPARVVGDSLSTEGYGAAVPPGSGGFVDFLNSALRAAQEDGRWAHAYARSVGVPPAAPPGLTIQDAAALWPTAVSDRRTRQG
jgi:ABC-type amino acid transport substrate-binding protein